MDFSVPARELINVVGLAEALIFALVLGISRQLRSRANTLLAVAFLIIATVKFDQLYQGMGGLAQYPEFAFVLTPLQWLIAPCLYFFVLVRVTPDFRFRSVHFWNLVPAILSFLYYLVTFYTLSPAAKVSFLNDGGLSTYTNRLFIPLIGDLVQLGYLVAALNLLKRYGVQLRSWFSKIEDRNLKSIRQVVSLWILVFAIHLALTLIIGVFGGNALVPILFTFLNLLQFAIINILMYAGMVTHFREAPAIATPLKEKQYAGSQQTPDERRELYARTLRLMESEQPFLESDLTLGELADMVATTPRALSEAINAEGRKNFYDFINASRLAVAKEKLRQDPDKAILQIAFESGFNSKSTFNTLFRKATGQTPSQYRNQNQTFNNA